MQTQGVNTSHTHGVLPALPIIHLLTDHRIILYIRKIGGTGRAREQQRWLDGWYRSGQGPGVLGGGEGLRNRLI